MLSAFKPHNFSKPFFVARAVVYKLCIVRYFARYHSEIRKLAHKRIGYGLENEQGVFAVFIKFTGCSVFKRICGILAGRHSFKQNIGHHRNGGTCLLYTAENRANIAARNTLFKTCFNFIGRKFLAGKIFFHKRIVRRRNGFKQHIPHFVYFVAYGHTHLLCVKAVAGIGLILNKIYVGFYFVVFKIGNNHGAYNRAVISDKCRYYPIKMSVRRIKLSYEKRYCLAKPSGF